MDWQADKTITQYITSHLGDCISTELRNNDCFCFLSRILEYKGEKSPIYYHSDHLGSAAYLTNDAGQVSQTLNYLPYGEDWVDIQNSLDPRLGQYTFNGKEKDSESGFHYYGARYYWSELLNGWLSVDPMADKYPAVSPYAYCAWNPVRIVDPDGQDGWDKVAGFCIGVLRNVSPRKGWLRDTYSPTNSSDYNNFLRIADNTMMAAGGIMTVAGAAGVAAGSSIIGGGAAVSMTGIGVPEGASVMIVGVAVDAASAAIGLVGSAMTMQATMNASQGYNRGHTENASDATGTKVQSKTFWKSKGKDGSHIDVENPSPGNRKGSIHYQEGNKKYLYNKKKGCFEGAPNSVNNRIKTDKGMQRLGRK